MGKTSGGVRTFKQGTKTYAKREAEVQEMIASGQYKSVEMTEGGGYVAIEKSPMKHKEDEIRAAHILAEHGYKVILTDESGNELQIKTHDGVLFVSTYEQKTPRIDKDTTIRNALYHAKSKRADIALLFSKDHAFSRESVEKGLELYESAQENAKSPWYFKEIIVVADNNHIHRHKHNK